MLKLMFLWRGGLNFRLILVVMHTSMHMHVNFNEFMINSWSGEEEVHVKLADLQITLNRWNKEVFGIIEGRKRRLLNRQNGI